MEDTVSGDVKRSTYTVKELLELRGRELDVEITIPSTVQSDDPCDNEDKNRDSGADKGRFSNLCHDQVSGRKSKSFCRKDDSQSVNAELGNSGGLHEERFTSFGLSFKYFPRQKADEGRSGDPAWSTGGPDTAVRFRPSMNNTSWRSHDRISNIVPKPPFYTREYFGPSYNTTAQHNNRIGDPDQSPVQKEVIPWLEDDKVSEPLCLSTLRLPEELELQRKALLGRQNLNKGTEKRAGSSDIRDTSPTSFSEDEVQKSQVWDEVVYKGDEATIFSDDHTQGPPDGKDFDVYRTTQYPDQLFARGGSSHTHIQDPSIGAEGIENDLPSKDGDPVLFEDDRFHKPPAKSFENYNDEEFKFSSSDDSLELHAEGDLKGPELVSFLRQQPSQEGAYKHQQPIPEFGVSVPISSIFGRSLMSDVDNDQISRGHHPQPSADPVIIPEAELIAHIKKSYTSTPPQNGEPPTFFPSTQMQHYPYNHPIEQLQNVSPPIFPIHPGGYFHYSDPGVSLSQRPIRIQNIFQRGPLAQQDYATLNTHRPPFHMESFHPLMEPFNLNSSQAIPGPFFPSPSTHGPKYASGDTIDRSDTIQRREDLRYTPSDLRRALTDKSHIPSSHQKSPST